MSILKRILLLSVFIMLMTGCSKERSSGRTAVESKSIVTATIGEPSTLIPLLATDSPSHEVAGLIYNGLVRYDKNLKIEGDLAQSWDVSPDGLKIVFHLRKGVKWHDDQPFTSEDVLYTYSVTVNPETPTAYAEDFKQVKSITAPDEYTVSVEYNKPFAPALSSWGMSILPSHLLKGKDITKSPLSRKPIGTGPFIFSSWTQGEKIVLSANSKYYEGKPKLEKYIYRVIPDSSTMYMELKGGGIDMMGLSPVQYQRQTSGRWFVNSFSRYRYPASAYTYLGYNLRNPLFQDREIRKAIAMCINREEIVQGVLLGMGTPTNGPFKPGTWAYNDKVSAMPYDPAAALEIFKRRGWEKGEGGILEKGGKKFSFTIITNQGNEQRIKIAQILQRRLSVIGIDVRIRVLEWASLISNFIDKGNFDALIMGWTIGQDPDIYDIWHSSKTGPKELNFIGYKNSEVDRMLEEGRSTFDIEKRKKAYYRIQEILQQDQPYTFLYVPDSLPVVNSRFKGIEPSPSGIMHNLIRWHVSEMEPTG